MNEIAIKEHLERIEESLNQIKITLAVKESQCIAHAKIISGNGSPPLNVRLDRIERVIAIGSRFVFGLAMAVLGLFINQVWKVFTG